MSREVTMDKITALAKNRGFIFPGSEIYGGLANTWDCVPLGVELKNNVKKAWWRKVRTGIKVQCRTGCSHTHESADMGGFRSCGRIFGSADRLQEPAKSRFRADKLIEDWLKAEGIEDVTPDGWSNEKMESHL